MLHIRAVKESLHGCGYTSARLKTRKRDGSPLFSQKYGRFEFRAKLPTGKGVWPALWMLPQDEKYGGWAASGEIDVMEARGQEPTKVLGTLHFGSRWPANTHVSKEYVLPRGGTIADFHVYALEWEPGEIRWSVDGQQYATQSFWWSSSKTDGAKGLEPGEGGRPQPVAGPVRPAVLPRHERGGRAASSSATRTRRPCSRRRWSSITSASTRRSAATGSPSRAARASCRSASRSCQWKVCNRAVA